MKHPILFCLLLCIWSACTETPKTSAPPVVDTRVADSAAIAQTIHGFYSWYDAFSRAETGKNDFVEPVGQHLKLNTAKFEAYFSKFKQTGFVSASFVEKELAFYKKCEPLWQNESIEDIPSGMDADKYFCAQDWELDFWVKSPVRIQPVGENKMSATLYGQEAGAEQSRNFELIKEGGKWLILSIECDMGI